MADKAFKVNDPITVKYQALGGQTGLTVQMDVFDESDVKDTGKSTTMAAVTDAPGTYGASFTPDAEGDWLVRITDSGGGKAIRGFSVGAVNLKDLATASALAVVDGKADAIIVAVADVQTVVDDIQAHLGGAQAMIG